MPKPEQMRVKDLIKSLRKMNPEALVYYTTGKTRMHFYQARYVEPHNTSEDGPFVTIETNKYE